MSRPILDKNISLEDFQSYYWLKEELIIFCNENGISPSGGKLDLSDRISCFISTGTIINPIRKKVFSSNFDWNNAKLSLETIITDNYKNSENVRDFFTKSIGTKFWFSVEFMNWIKGNEGKTLGDAINAWYEIVLLKKNKNYKTEILPQFKYNAYIRDFLADNPGKSTIDAIQSWKIQRDHKGNHKYSRKNI